jgi:hypothetical protein
MTERTYGDLTFDSETHKWTISNLEPHVAMAFKRLFPKVPKATDVLLLADTDENRADLDWFTIRYPLRHSFTKALAHGAHRIGKRVAERGLILAPEWTPPPFNGFKEGEAPYLYQAQAVQIALNQGALLVGDDVGLGKTETVIAAGVMGAPLPMAIVVKPDLAIQWRRRVERFCHLRPHIIQSRQPYDLPPADIYIFKYSNIGGWSDALKELKFPSVAWDEIQELRHGDSTEKGFASRKLTEFSSFRMATSATPTYNYGDEIHTVMSYVQPDVFGPRDDFTREWCGGGKIVTNPDALGSFLVDSGYFLRRDENDPSVDRSMPPPNMLDFKIDCDEGAIDKEMDVLRILALKVLEGSFNERGQASRALDMRMRQLTGIGKARYVAAYVKMLLTEYEKVIIAGWHREFHDIILRQLARFNPRLYTGSENAALKDRNVQEFINGDCRAISMSLRSTAGLDGVQKVCWNAVIGELDWSPMVHKQFIGRARRPGQPYQVNGHLLWTDFGSDPPMLEMLGVKSDQSRGIIDPGKAIAPREVDESRVKMLAKYVLEQANPVHV